MRMRAQLLVFFWQMLYCLAAIATNSAALHSTSYYWANVYMLIFGTGL
jgi:hypothetical protein